MPNTGTTGGTGTASLLGRAHRRFARAAILIYVCSSVLAVAMLAVSLAMDRDHEVASRRNQLLVETHARARFLARHLNLLARELSRLARRPELDALAQDAAPARQLLRLVHERSALFGSGVAVVGMDDRVAVSAPPDFLPAGTSIAAEPWARGMKRRAGTRIVPVTPAKDDALVYLVTPVVRERAYRGALVGALDLDKDDVIQRESQVVTAILSTWRGEVVYPSRPPPFTREPAWTDLVTKNAAPFIVDTSIAGVPTFVACVEVPDTHFRLLTLVPREEVLAPARARLVTRLGAGMSLATLSLGVLVLILVRSLRVFRRSQEAALREENLRQLGEATNLIAHEVKNSLNGLRLGVDIVLRRARFSEPSGSAQQTAGALTQELQRLIDFTSELLLFSKGISPRLVSLDLGELVRRVGDLLLAPARDQAVELEVSVPEGAVQVKGDPALLHMVLSNLITNGLEAAAGGETGRGGRRPRVEVRLERSGKEVCVRVNDTGPGVPASIRDRLFEPFVTGKPSGVGIGLALSLKIALAHGGDLILDATAPCTSFVLRLPAEIP